MWLHEPVGLDLCFLQPTVSEAFYGYLELTVLEIYLLTEETTLRVGENIC
jgi:hypothetical protein